MEQWNPSKKGEGGNSLYGSMIRQVQLAGGKVKGVLWYQGESDAIGGEAWKVYPQVFADFIAAVRSDFGQPELPFYFVQIGRFVTGGDPKGWNAVQDAQRRLPERVPNTAVVSVIDLELDDAIHVGTQGLKRTGQRLARIAQRELFGQIGATTPTLDRVARGPNNTLVVKFKGVNMAARHGRIGRGRDDGGHGRHGHGHGSGADGMGGSDGRRPPASLEPRRVRRARPEARAAHRRVLDPQGRRHRHPADLRGRRRHGPRHRGPEARRPVPAEVVPLVRLRLDPYCNLTDGVDMAVPVFGPDRRSMRSPSSKAARPPLRDRGGSAAGEVAAGRRRSSC